MQRTSKAVCRRCRGTLVSPRKLFQFITPAVIASLLASHVHAQDVEFELSLGPVAPPAAPTTLDKVQIQSIDYMQAGVQLAPPWHLDRIDQRSLPLSGTYAWQGMGAGVNVYIVSAGINALHEDLKADDGTSRVTADYTIDPASPAGTDSRGEGTASAALVGGRVSGVAKSARIHSVRVFQGDSGITPKAEVIKGLQWIRDNHQKPAIVLWNTYPEKLSMNSTDVDKNTIISELTALGIPVIVPAGIFNPTSATDTPDGCLVSPAASNLTFTVSASNSTDQRAVFNGATAGEKYPARFGSCVDMYAPGEALNVPWIGPTNTEMLLTGGPFLPPALVAGAAAIYLEAFPDATVSQVYDAIRMASTQGAVAIGGSLNGIQQPPAALLYSQVVQNAAVSACIYAMNMEFSSSGARHTGPDALIAVVFSNSLPEGGLQPSDITITMDGQPAGAVKEGGIVAHPTAPNTVLVALSLPDDRTGVVSVSTVYPGEPLQFTQSSYHLTVQTLVHAMQ